MKDTQKFPEGAPALELRPCPFCGTAEPSSEIVRAYGKSDWRSKMRCTACGASSGWSDPMGHDDSTSAAIEIWNMRVNSGAHGLQSKETDDQPRLVSNVAPN